MSNNEKFGTDCAHPWGADCGQEARIDPDDFVKKIGDTMIGNLVLPAGLKNHDNALRKDEVQQIIDDKHRKIRLIDGGDGTYTLVTDYIYANIDTSAGSNPFDNTITSGIAGGMHSTNVEDALVELWEDMPRNIEDLQNVSITSIKEGDILRYKSGQWVNVKGIITPSVVDVYQASHGFAKNDIGTPVYFNVTTNLWERAISDNIRKTHSAVIRDVNDADNFEVQQGGLLNNIDPSVTLRGSTLIPGEIYRLSETTSGQIVDNVPPNNVIYDPVLRAISPTSAMLLSQAPVLPESRQQKQLSEDVTQTLHGYSSNDIGIPLSWDGTSWNRFHFASTIQLSSQFANGVLGKIIDNNTINVVHEGIVNNVYPRITEANGPVLPGNFYRVSNVTNGKITDNLPNNNDVTQYVCYGLGNNTMYVSIQDPYEYIDPSKVASITHTHSIGDINDYSDAPRDGNVYGREDGKWVLVVSAGVGAGGDHNTLTNKNLANQHQISAITGLQTALDSKLPLTGGTLTGNLLLNGDPVLNKQAATKKYVDDGILTTLSAKNTFTGAIDSGRAPKLDGAGYLDSSFMKGHPLNFEGVFDPTITDGAYVSGNAIKNNDPKWVSGDLVIANKNGKYDPTTGVTGSGLDISVGDWLIFEGATIGWSQIHFGSDINTTNLIWRDGSHPPTHDIPFQNFKITGLGMPSSNRDAATKEYVDDRNLLDLQLTGGTMTGTLVLSGDPLNNMEAATKHYVDDTIRPLKTVAVRDEISANYTLDLDDGGAYLRCINTVASNITVPPFSAVQFPMGTTITFEQGSTGKVTIKGATGVTVNSSTTLISFDQYSIITLVKVDLNTWTLTGDLQAS
jgi:hypothetical protein